MFSEREDYRYSGSENEEEDDVNGPGEPSSIIQAPGDNTLRRNFQQIQVIQSSEILAPHPFTSERLNRHSSLQEGKALCAHIDQKESKYKDKDREEIPEPGPPSRPPINQRLIGKYNTCVFLYPRTSISIN